MATLVMDMGIIRMGIIDRIRTTMRGLHSTGRAGTESIIATIVIITTAVGTKLA